MTARQPAARAVVSIRAVYVDCPHCGETQYEPATPIDVVPWGKTGPCWACKRPIKYPRSPFGARRL